VFTILTAPHAKYDQSIEVLHQPNINETIADLKRRILQKSPFGIKQLANIFKAMDRNGNGSLDMDDFRWGFIDYGFQI